MEDAYLPAKSRNRPQTLVSISQFHASVAISVLLLTNSWLLAANGPENNQVLNLEIGETELVTKFDSPVVVPVTIQNLSTDTISGTVVIGGPTGGIYPLSEPSQEFSLEAGESLTTAFSVAFDTSCSNGLYPIHSFVDLSNGRDLRKRAATLLETDFADSEPWAGRNPEVAEFQDRRSRSPVDAFLKLQRIKTLADFIRETKDLNHHQAFRLGADLDSFAVLVLPGKNGLLDGLISFIGPNQELSFQGLTLGVETPVGVDGEPQIQVDEFISTQVENGIDVMHRLRIGDFATEVVVQLRLLEGGVKLRAVSPDPVSRFGVGKANRKPTTLTAGLGYHFNAPGDWTLGKDSPLLSASHAGFDFENGISLMQASSSPLEQIEISPSQNLARIIAPGSGWLYLIPSEESVFDAAAKYRELGEWEAAPGVPNFAGRFVIDSSQTHFADLADRVEELRRYGINRSALVVRNWQQHGPMERSPDVWPPNDDLGSLTDLQILAKTCRECEILFGLEDTYAAIDPLSKEFDYESVAFQANGSPTALNANPGGNPTFALRPDQIEPYLSRNLKLIRYYLTPTLFVIDGSESGRSPYFDREGNRYNQAYSQEIWRQTVSYVQGYLGPTSASVAKGGGDWLVGAADGTGFEVRASDLPGPAQRVPWFSIVHHDRLPVYEMGADLDSGSGEALLREVTEGSLPMADDQAWGHSMIRKAWLMQPVAEALAGSAVNRVSRLEDDPRRMRCLWGENGLLWINASNEGWRVSGREVAPGGFYLSSGETEVSVELRNGVYCEQSISPAGWYVNARPRHWSALHIQPSLKNVSVAEGNALIRLGWTCEETFPPETELLLQIHDSENPEVIWAEEVLQPSEPVSSWIGQKEMEVPLDLTLIPGVRAVVSLTARTPNGRPIKMLAQTLDVGRYAGFSARLGQISLGFDGNGELAGIEALPSDPAGLESVEQINSSLRPIDFGWTTTNGAFRLTQAADGLVMMPLPDCPPFEATLNLGALKIDPNRVLGVVSREVYSAGWKLSQPELAEGILTIRHDPKNFSYSILLRSETDRAGDEISLLD
tara:strand:+ start:3220 stop:6402 length:3183 start_codon:yes stop_codon:yes gene_type:complete